MLTVSSAPYLVCKLIDFFTENISTRCFRDERTSYTRKSVILERSSLCEQAEPWFTQEKTSPGLLYSKAVFSHSNSPARGCPLVTPP